MKHLISFIAALVLFSAAVTCALAESQADAGDKNDGEVLDQLLKAADYGNASAMNSIGIMYFQGLGVKQDYGKAMEWSKKAADSGNGTAAKNLRYLQEIMSGK